MGAALFYHLTQSGAEDLIGATLLPRALSRGWRVMLRGTDARRLDWWDERLWLNPEDGFLPHGRDTAPNAARQPVLIGEGPALNGAQGVILIDGAQTDAAEIAAMERVWIVFEGADAAAVEGARAQWRRLAAEGAGMEYWSDETGRWQKKSERPATAP
ncbi:DNA polymerase III subunit chi [Neotabrizicola shimadae]|uniref:DNA polymerase III subunit chi n=1 Tax=Neotabrizicola shimadae TaxID=2807096 RepID=A0A8G0ZVD9_9RHOB|nr:DNA polymerase III subunit chi [Neotabrizicola shimadae]QYZ71164.1 DNA polymerase III subunit chi [Neotabrizicola shimadae]